MHTYAIEVELVAAHDHERRDEEERDDHECVDERVAELRAVGRACLRVWVVDQVRAAEGTQRDNVSALSWQTLALNASDQSYSASAAAVAGSTTFSDTKLLMHSAQWR